MRATILILTFMCMNYVVADPVVYNVRGQQAYGTNLVEVYYNLYSPAYVRLEVSTNSGTSWDVPVNHVYPSPDELVSSGVGNLIIWDAGRDWGGNYSENVRFRVTAFTYPWSELDIVLVFDTSGSMSGNKIQDAKAAAISFIGNLQMSDRIGVVKFNSVSTALIEPTINHQAVMNAINALGTGGGTLMYEGIYDALDLLAEVQGNRSVIVFTDGSTTTSTHTKAATIAYAVNLGVPVFTIALGAGATQRDILEQIALETGGEFYNAPEASDLLEIYNTIATRQRTQ